MAKNKKKSKQPTPPAPDKSIELEGTVTEALPNSFRVKTKENHEVICYLSGKIKLHKIKILPGDKVTFEVSPYDLTKGRITYRYKGDNQTT